MRYLLVLLGLLVTSTAQASIDCSKQPDCTSLGFVKTDDPDCASNGYMYCPFDKSYKKCVERDCAKLGFTPSDKTSWCADIIKCNANTNYTLCETPCVAWDATTLTTLAGSGKCRVLTMLNDITLPEKTILRLAKNTIIDGGSHTLNVSETASADSSSPNIYFENLTGLKNIHVYKKDLSGKGGRVMDGWAKVSFENVIVQDENNGSSSSENKSILHLPYMISVTGVFNVKRINGYHHILLNDGDYVFENAKVEVTDSGNGSGDIFTGTSSVKAVNSEINVDAKGFLCSASGFTLDNSKLKVSSKATLCYTSKVANPCLFTLKNGSEFEFSNASPNPFGTAKITLSGEEGHPVKVITSVVNSPITLDVQNLNAVLVYNNKTYVPTSLGETKLTEVVGSSGWKEQ